MLRSGCTRTLAVVLRRRPDIARWSSNITSSSHHPNAPLDLDPAFQALLRDVEMSLQKAASAGPAAGPRELEVSPHDPDATVDYLTSAEIDARDDDIGGRGHKKSPAALFGSQRIGAVVLPHEMQESIQQMVAGECSVYQCRGRVAHNTPASDKPSLHQDAKRLFLDDSGQRPEWSPTYDIKYKSGREAGKHALRDATAFATVALPSHYSAIYAVLDHARLRLGPEWQVRRVIDWGAATGSGLWSAERYINSKYSKLIMIPPSRASGHVFQDPAHEDMAERQVSQSFLDSYLGIDKREGLVRIGKRLIRGIPARLDR